MAVDPASYPLLLDELLERIQQPDVLLQVGPYYYASLEIPTETASCSWSGFSQAEIDQLIPLQWSIGLCYY